MDPDEDDRFLYLEPLDSQNGYEIMETFVRTADTPDALRDRLYSALDAPKLFRRFRDALHARNESSGQGLATATTQDAVQSQVTAERRGDLGMGNPLFQGVAIRS